MSFYRKLFFVLTKFKKLSSRVFCFQIIVALAFVNWQGFTDYSRIFYNKNLRAILLQQNINLATSSSATFDV